MTLAVRAFPLRGSVADLEAFASELQAPGRRTPQVLSEVRHQTRVLASAADRPWPLGDRRDRARESERSGGPHTPGRRTSSMPGSSIRCCR